MIFEPGYTVFHCGTLKKKKGEWEMMDMEEVKAVTARLNERIPSYSDALDDLALLRDFALAAIPVIEAENAALRELLERCTAYILNHTTDGVVRSQLLKDIEKEVV